jgi:hypothetical protein
VICVPSPSGAKEWGVKKNGKMHSSKDFNKTPNSINVFADTVVFYTTFGSAQPLIVTAVFKKRHFFAPAGKIHKGKKKTKTRNGQRKEKSTLMN